MNEVKRIAEHIGQLFPLPFLRKMAGQPLVHMFYHAVSDVNLPHIQHLYPVKNTKQFTRDLEILLKYYTPLSPEEFLSHIQNGEKIKKPSFLLSFDDGLREFKTVIAPILEQKGIPAICFLNGSFIDNKALFYRYKASLLVEHIQQNPSSIKSPNIQQFCAQLNWNADQLNQHLLQVKYANQAILDELAEALNFRFEDFLQKQQPYLNTDEILALQTRGFTFGAHSMDHPEYRFVDFREQLRQTTESMAKVKKYFHPDYDLFSFPHTDEGVSDAFFKQLNAEQKVDATFGTAGLKNENIANHFQRIPLEDGDKDALQILKTEYFYYLMKSLFGKNTIRR